MENDEKFNLDDIKNIEPEEFKKQISDWVEEKGINKILQSRLRKDLIESFNKTSLGRKMSAEYQTAHRMVLSPLILAMNTLVAEFLYAQNCHFSLSVFSSEVPFKNTLPNFENEEQFRFSKSELEEIFDAIGIESDEVCKEYLANNSQSDKRSLLFCLMKFLCNKFKSKTDPVQDKVPNPVKETENTKLDSTDLKNLNQYLETLSTKMKEMSKELKKLQNKNNSTEIRPASFKKLEFMNKSLERITHDVRMIDQASIEGRQVSDVVRSVDRLSRRLERSLEKSVKKFENYSNETQRLQTSNESIVPYRTWVKDMKQSENGKRFMDKIKTSLSKTLKKEKLEFEKEYKERIENEKSIIKLHYKQKFLEKSVLEEPKPVPVVEPKKPKYVEIYPSIPPQRKETNINHIVEDARQRLQVIEKEDDILDKSFQNYLKKQTNDKRQVQGFYKRIIENLNVEQNVLSNQKLVSTVPPMFFSIREPEVSPINGNSWDFKELSIEDESKEREKYENPFRALKPKVLDTNRTIPEIQKVEMLSSKPSRSMNKNDVQKPKIDLPTNEHPEPIQKTSDYKTFEMLSSRPSRSIEKKEGSKPKIDFPKDEIPLFVDVNPEPIMKVTDIIFQTEKEEEDMRPKIESPEMTLKAVDNPPREVEQQMDIPRPISPKILIVSPEREEIALDTVTRQVDKRFLSEFYDKNSSESDGQIILSTGDKSSSDEFWK